MSLTNNAVFIQQPGLGLANIVNADGTTKKTVVTGGTNGTKVTSLTLTSTDTSSRVVQVWVTRSATSYCLGSVTVAITAGTDGVTAGVSVLTNTLLPGIPVDNDGQAYLILAASDTLQVAVNTGAVTAAKEIDAVAVKADF